MILIFIFLVCIGKVSYWPIVVSWGTSVVFGFATTAVVQLLIQSVTG